MSTIWERLLEVIFYIFDFFVWLFHGTGWPPVD